jgi:hypothetical protein
MTDRSSFNRQTPAPGEIFLDHLGWYVPDMDAAAAAFARLGFRLTPLAAHADEQPDGSRRPSGTANRCAMLERGYLELLTDAPGLDTPRARELRAGVARYTGLHLIAFTCADAAAEGARLRAAGFDPQPTVRLRRPAPLDAGGEGTAAFSVVRLPAGAMPEGRIQLLTQETPEVVWQPSLIARDNAVAALSGVVIVSADAEEAARRFARYLGAPAGPRRTFGLARGRVAVMSEAEFRAALPGIAVPALPFIGAAVLRSRDLAATRAFLARQGVRLAVDRPGRIAVSPVDAMGAAIVIDGGDGGRPALP